MALTDKQIKDLASRMDVPLAFVDFKDMLMTEPMQYNKGYVINMEDEYDSRGRPNDGSHWVGLYIRKNPNGTIEPMYFDSFGVPAPREVSAFVKKFTGVHEVPYNTKDVQSLMVNYCGYYVLVWLHYICAFPHRTGDLYHDTNTFIDFFNDLNHTTDFKRTNTS